MRRRRSNTAAFVGATLVGLAGGWLLARTHDEAQRHNLFAREAYRRYAALGWLASEGDAGHVGVLQDYLAWEKVPSLRQRARRIIATLEALR